MGKKVTWEQYATMSPAQCADYLQEHGTEPPPPEEVKEFRRRLKKLPFTIVIDTREQRPYKFDHPTPVAGLKTGDYSILGYENKICIERKSKEDAYGTIGAGRHRFERELERMVWYDYAAIVIESTLKGFLSPPTYSGLHPNSAINSLVSWSVRYNVHVFFCGSRRYASALTFRILEKYWKYQQRLKLEE